jgi:hypothetical protein
MLEGRPKGGHTTLIDDIAMYRRFAAGLRGYLKRPLTAADCAAMRARQRASHEESFLRILEQGVYGNPRSPYRRLLDHAGIELGDVTRLVREDGLEEALGRLYDAGVHIGLHEVKGRRPVQRPGLEFAVSEHDFDNPLLRRHFEARSGGSRSPGRRTAFDLAHLEFEAAQFALFCEELDLTARPAAVWYPAPPGFAGLGGALVMAKLGRRVERWFSQTAVPVRSSPRAALLTSTAVGAGRLWAGGRIPWPEHVPPLEAEEVASWLADKAAGGSPGMVITYPSSAVSACAAAVDRGLDIAGSFFYVGGEPYTEEKARVVERAGARAVSWYGMTETGTIGLPCGRAELTDEVHVLPYKLAILKRPTRVGAVDLETLLVTTLVPYSPKLMLNMDTGDYAVLEEHDCACELGEAGFRWHLHTIRSHEKLTAAGMTFLGEDLLTVIEEVLPARFGGSPEDYQLVEEEAEAGVPQVTLVVSPRLGQLDDGEMIDTIFAHLAAEGGANRMMADVWRGGEVVRVARREPHVTTGGKVLPLHLKSVPAPRGRVPRTGRPGRR